MIQVKELVKSFDGFFEIPLVIRRPRKAVSPMESSRVSFCLSLRIFSGSPDMARYSPMRRVFRKRSSCIREALPSPNPR